MIIFIKEQMLTEADICQSLDRGGSLKQNSVVISDAFASKGYIVSKRVSLRIQLQFSDANSY